MAALGSVGEAGGDREEAWCHDRAASVGMPGIGSVAAALMRLRASTVMWRIRICRASFCSGACHRSENDGERSCKVRDRGLVGEGGHDSHRSEERSNPKTAACRFPSSFCCSMGFVRCGVLRGSSWSKDIVPGLFHGNAEPRPAAAHLIRDEAPDLAGPHAVGLANGLADGGGHDSVPGAWDVSN